MIMSILADVSLALTVVLYRPFGPFDLDDLIGCD